MAQQQFISVVIITHNEERNIGRCLDSVALIADEIVVVDSGSTDRTAEICEQYKVKFHRQSWLGYSEQKNLADGLATHDWILSLDADEALSSGLREELLQLKKNPIAGAYTVNRLTNYCGKWIHHCGWYPDKKVRLFPKNGSRWQGTIHEQLLLPNGIAMHGLKNDLEHYSYYTKGEHLERVHKYAKLKAEQMHKAGKTASSLKGTMSAWSRFIGMYFFKLGFLDGAAGWQICNISAKAAKLKYTYLNALNKS